MTISFDGISATEVDLTGIETDVTTIQGPNWVAYGSPALDTLAGSGWGSATYKTAAVLSSNLVTAQSNISTNTSNISTNTSDITTIKGTAWATNGSADLASLAGTGYGSATYKSVATLSSNLVTAQSNISTNTSNITTLQNFQGRGACAYVSGSDLTAVNTTGGSYFIPLNGELYDTDSVHDNVTNNTRLTVPSGVTKVRIVGAVLMGLGTTSDTFLYRVYKNGASFAGSPGGRMIQTPSVNTGASFSSSVLDVSAGDYFQILVQTGSDTSITIWQDLNWLAMEIIK